MTKPNLSCFDDAPEFIDEDNRRFRIHNPISKSQMLAKHELILPADIVKGKTVLDLGSCMGATGHWCLSNGASHYVGVELQHSYVELSRKLLTKYHPGKFKIEEATIEQWLAQPHAEPYDIVCLFGVLYAFSDYFTILKQAAALSREWVAIDALYPKIENPDNFCGVVFIRNQPINLADKNASVVGRGTRISPKGMIWLMEEFGYSAPDYLILPSLSSNDVDVYRYEGDLSKKRYLMRFKKDVAASKSITRQLIDGDGHILTWEAINRLRQSENN